MELLNLLSSFSSGTFSDESSSSFLTSVLCICCKFLDLLSILNTHFECLTFVSHLGHFRVFFVSNFVRKIPFFSCGGFFVGWFLQFNIMFSQSQCLKTFYDLFAEALPMSTSPTADDCVSRSSGEYGEPDERGLRSSGIGKASAKGYIAFLNE